MYVDSREKVTARYQVIDMFKKSFKFILRVISIMIICEDERCFIITPHLMPSFSS